MSAPKIPLNFFGMPFGLAGLGEAWTVLAGYHRASIAVAEIILATSAVVWLVVVVAYLRHLASDRGVIARDLLDPIAAPFASLALITPMLLASEGLYPHAATAGRVITDVFLVLMVVLAGWFTGQWIYRPVDLDRFHPGYFLPSVAGGLVASASAAVIGQRRLAEVMFGFGVMSWLVLGSIILGRLLFRPMLPPALQPTLAIEVAPAAVASLAWLEMHGGQLDAVTAFLAGYGLLMVVAQLRLLPVYRRLSFMASTWAFTFSWAAVATVVVMWLQDAGIAGYRGWQYLDIAVITLLIGAIGVRTLLAISRGQLMPKPASPTPASTTPASTTPVAPQTVADRVATLI
jgi:tellurite resistance protein